jgi:cobalamin-dependent methionine synthase I
MATTDRDMEKAGGDDPYSRMLAQTLSDRLAEATVEKMHLEVRKHYWGYAKDEDLSIEDLLNERFTGIRPAVGYPSLPDTGINFIIHKMLGARRIGIRLTQSGMMIPHASVSGLMIAHPEARYFSIGKIGEDQLADYARRRGLPLEVMRKFLATNL